MLGHVQHIHFLGIGGIGMCGLAELLHSQGYTITGSDLAEAVTVERLRHLGVPVLVGHAASNLGNADLLVYSSAIRSNNPELIEAQRREIPVVSRGEMLAEVMRLQDGIAIAGTHGKTTTTSLVGTVLAGGNLDPTVVIGGRLKSIGGHAQFGESDILVAEADESDGSFLHLSPTIAVVTTLDEEHMDYYKTLENMKETFLSFLNRVPFYGSAVLCLDDPNLQSMIPFIEKRHITYGLTTQADYTARNIFVDGLKTYFTVHYQGKELGTILSGALGNHNVCNTLAAVAVGMELNMDFTTIVESLKGFTGVQRRFEIVHESESLLLVDDYGHHPAEIRATLKTAKLVWPDRHLTVVFQPHRFSRTRLLLKDFWSAFNDADRLMVLDIYSAGEQPVAGIDGKVVAEGIKNFGHKNVEYINNKKQAVSRLIETLKPDSVVMTLGAGDVWEIGQELLSNLPEREQE